MTISVNSDHRAIELLETLETLADPAVGIAWLRNGWVSSSPGDVASVLEVAAAGADAGIRIYRDGLLALSVAVSSEDFAAVRHEAASYAIVHGLERARGLLVPETIAEVERRTKEPTAQGRFVTLGERKSLARDRRATTIEKVLRDPDPSVIRILLANPALRQDDVLKLTSRRGVDAAVLREIFVHPRWFVRYPVRVSLVQNPGLPTTIGLAIVRSLLRQDAESIASNTTLAESLRLVARADTGRPSIH